MKISSGLMQFFCGILFLTSFSPMQGQQGMTNYLQGKFNTYWQNLKDFKDCLTNKKKCSSREKAVKYTTLTVVGTVLLGALLLFGPRTPGMIRAYGQISGLEKRIKKTKDNFALVQKNISDAVIHDRINNLSNMLSAANKECLIKEWKYCKDAIESLATELNDLDSIIESAKI